MASASVLGPEQDAVIQGGKLVVRTRALNAYLVCELCNGYFRNATTVSECLHTFCEPCILRHFDSGSTKCPTCETDLGADPFTAIRQDMALKSLVERIFPNAGPGTEPSRKKKRKRSRSKSTATAAGAGAAETPTNDAAAAAEAGEPEAKRARKLENKKSAAQSGRVGDVSVTTKYLGMDKSALPPNVSVSSKGIVTVDNVDWVKFAVHPDPNDAATLALPSIASVMQTKASIDIKRLAKHLRKKLCRNIPGAKIEILFNGEVCAPEFSLEFIIKTRWHSRDSADVLDLTYRMIQS
ncbi:uncharacterized protein AMSG_03173 [Thecamonas trahens ATCC 50062]|uniref:RING-type domain-containing protein n=1 Tax=Thecamonas trahens ATCC 50062 TaxID=461836 RepID=A0A0L0D358_THETB|nr:hypothetical protein AMSG_03173 [Thecamonas trahens ATCC 50062]KNC46744.1 hypothetical protein AMSG_03173 [Thecamonas trahens ATCC 50062]|eukprot:XP_013760024.1 hypothetical protein AMSG_03173 [Thecamonas trahens ATCC 50062]